MKSTSKITILKPGDEALLEAFLLPRIEASMFLVGNMRASGLLDHGRAYSGTYAAAFESGEITGVVAHYWNQNLVFQAPVERDLKPLWQAAVVASQRPISGLIGPNDQVVKIKEELGIDDSMVQMDAFGFIHLALDRSVRIGNRRETQEVESFRSHQTAQDAGPFLSAPWTSCIGKDRRHAQKMGIERRHPARLEV